VDRVFDSTDEQWIVVFLHCVPFVDVPCHVNHLVPSDNLLGMFLLEAVCTGIVILYEISTELSDGLVYGSAFNWTELKHGGFHVSKVGSMSSI
jgi:hypothetical protein